MMSKSRQEEEMRFIRQEKARIKKSDRKKFEDELRNSDDPIHRDLADVISTAPKVRRPRR